MKVSPHILYIFIKESDIIIYEYTFYFLNINFEFSEALPIFGVSLDLAVERSRCHDGVDLPLPIRDCIDYIESVGITFEGVYKISGTKTKVSQIKKMYNHRQNVRLSDYDVPTATSLLKMFLR